MCISLAMSGLCCAGSAFCKNCCKCCRECCGTSLKEQIRIAYIFFTLIMMLFVIFILYWLQDIIEPFENFISCPARSGGKLTCLGVSAVYRMSFFMAVLYIIIMICMICKNEFSKALNEGLWCFKISFVLFFWVGSLFIDNSFFDGYRDAAKVISMVYIVFQSVVFIEIFYIWGFRWFNRYAEAQNKTPMACLLISTSLVILISTILLNVYNLIWFKGCNLNLAVSIINICIIAITIIIQIIKTGSLIATLANSFYITYLTFSAQLSGPQKNCTELYFNQYALYIELGVAFVFTVILLFYLTFAKREDSSVVVLIPGNILTSQKDKEIEEQEEQEENEKINQKKENDDVEDKKQQQQPQVIQVNVAQEDKNLKGYQTNAFIFFHLVMAITSVYCAMLITNWGSPPVESQAKDSYKPSEFSFWAKIITSWLSGLIYIYTIFRKQIIDKQKEQNQQNVYVVNQ